MRPRFYCGRSVGHSVPDERWPLSDPAGPMLSAVDGVAPSCNHSVCVHCDIQPKTATWQQRSRSCRRKPIRLRVRRSTYDSGRRWCYRVRAVARSLPRGRYIGSVDMPHPSETPTAERLRFRLRRAPSMSW